VKSAIRIFILFLMLQLLASAGGALSDVPSIFADSPTLSSQPRVYSTSDSLDQITADVNREAKEKTSPSPYVLYSDTGESTPMQTPDTSGPRPAYPTSASSLAGAAATLTNFVPLPNDRNALKKYLSLVSPSTDPTNPHPNGMNAGLVDYFKSEVANNPCLQRRAVDFYTSVGRATKDLTVDTPNIFSNVKTDSHGRLAAGWLWKLALQASGGDGGLALTLVGMCGHDDKFHDSEGGEAIEFRDDTDAARSALIYKQNRYAAIRADLLSKTPRPTIASKALLAGIDQQVASLKKAQSTTAINCPFDPNPFFLPESLGAGVDIDSALKQEIDRSQNPDHLFKVPAKYYHVYAGAFLSCGMIESGMSPAVAKSVASLGARLYRGLYLCQVLSDNAIGSVPTYKTAQAFLQSAEAPKKCRNHSFLKSNQAICDLLTDATFYKQSIKDPGELRKKIDSLFVDADASFLYRLWYGGGLSVAGRDLPCIDQQVMGPKDLLSNESNASPYDNGFNVHTPFKPFSWTNGRYENAKRKLATWVDDAKWTVAQHEVGAEFAAKTCRKRPESESIEQAACRIDAQKSGHPTAPAKAVH
jgi:hypothetical protein